ncbi:radical SAM/SPASM domain-containing protein [Chloroflexota bacterium]
MIGPGNNDMSGIKPSKIRLEASSSCQLRCPSCPNTSKALKPVVGSGFLKLRDFQRLIDENPWVQEIELSNYGEIFLNPELLEVIKHAYKRGVALKAENGVNLNNVRENVLEGLVRYKFRSMTCSIDAATNETYKVYRVKGNFETVIENVKKINLFKQQYQSEYPQLTWQFVIFGHNEHEIALAQKLASALDMSFYLKLAWDDRLSPVRDQEYVRQLVGVTSREEYKQKYGVEYLHEVCHQLWNAPQINWNGKLLGCCRNFWGDFGVDAFNDGLLESINNDKIKYARDMLLGKKPAREDIPCTTCSLYMQMKAEGRWLVRSPLDPGEFEHLKKLQKITPKKT